LCIIKKTVLEDVSILYESLNESKSSIFLPKDSKIFDSYKDSYRNRKKKKLFSKMYEMAKIWSSVAEIQGSFVELQPRDPKDYGIRKGTSKEPCS